MQSAYEALLSRQSVPLLQAPAPDKVQVHKLITAAICAPDHHKLRPWYFTVFSGEALTQLGHDFLAAALVQNPELDAVQQAKIIAMPLRAPMVIMATIVPVLHPKVPCEEQILSLGAAIQNVLLAIETIGFSAMWRSGDLAWSIHLKQQLKLTPETIIGGFIYIGSAVKPRTERVLLDASEFVRYVGFSE